MTSAMPESPERPRARNWVGSRWLPAMIIALLTASLADATSAATRTLPAVGRVIGTDPGTPPPEVPFAFSLSVTDQGGPPSPSLRPYLAQFILLYTSYERIPAHAKKPTFSAWLILHGLVDPTTHQVMMLLYEWAERYAG